MNLLVLTNLYPPHYVGGYELHCRLIVDALRSRGHKVHVLTSSHEVPGITSGDEPQISRELQIHGLFGHPFRSILSLHHLETHNNAVLRSTLERVRPELVFIWAFAGLSKSMLHTLQDLNVPTAFAVCDHWIARSHEADVWLQWWNRKDGSVAQKALRAWWEATGKRRDFDRKAPTRPVTELAFKRLYFCSRALRDFTASAGFDVGHGAVIYCPLDTELFDGKPKRQHQPLQKLLYAGRLHEDKGVFTALKAMSLIRDKFAGTLSIYGSGHPAFEARLHRFVTDQKLPVTFHKIADPAEMPAIYRDHDALLFTSEWAEPFALTPLEAMACGLPVIGTTTGGSAELFRNGENALTYSAGDPAALAQCILELDSDPVLREQIAAAGHHEVRSRFNASSIVSQVENYLVETVQTWSCSIPQPAHAI